jgi:hypothetical protein
MTDKEFFDRQSQIHDKYKRELNDLLQQYFKERGNVHKEGTVLKLKDGSLIVEHAKVQYAKGQLPIIKYIGQNLTTEGRVSKRQPTREILETEIVRVIRTRKGKDE